MALSKKSLSPLLSYSKRVLLDLEGTGGRAHWKSLCSRALVLFCACSLGTCTHHMSLLPCLCSVTVLDKLDEILAAAQHTITSDNQGQKGHGGKRDRSKSIVPNISNEVHWEIGNWVILSFGRSHDLKCCYFWPSGAVVITATISE